MQSADSMAQTSARRVRGEAKAALPSSKCSAANTGAEEEQGARRALERAAEEQQVGGDRLGGHAGGGEVRAAGQRQAFQRSSGSVRGRSCGGMGEPSGVRCVLHRYK